MCDSVEDGDWCTFCLFVSSPAFALNAHDATVHISYSDVHTRLGIACILAQVRLAHERVDGIRCKPVNSGPPLSSVSFVFPERVQPWSVQSFEPQQLRIQSKSEPSHFHWALSFKHTSCMSDAKRREQEIYTALRMPSSLYMKREIQ